MLSKELNCACYRNPSKEIILQFLGDVHAYVGMYLRTNLPRDQVCSVPYLYLPRKEAESARQL